jgi:hypothetical protein
MSPGPFPGPGQDGEEPPPGVPARDGTADDFDMDAAMARFLAGIETGREQIPEPWIGLQPVGSEMLAAADHVAEA